MELKLMMISKIILISQMFFYGQNLNQEKLVDSDKEIKSISYEGTETIRTAFGSTKVVYVVSNKNMVYTYDLGHNNTREVREIIVYKKKKIPKKLNLNARGSQQIKDNKEVKEEEIRENKETKENKENIEGIEKEVKEKKIIEIENTNSNKTITIILIETYERLVEQGIRSLELYSQLADAIFYKNDYTKASKYYFEFFMIEKKYNQNFTCDKQ